MHPIAFTPGLLAGGHPVLAKAEQAREDSRSKQRPPIDQAATAAK